MRTFKVPYNFVHGMEITLGNKIVINGIHDSHTNKLSGYTLQGEESSSASVNKEMSVGGIAIVNLDNTECIALSYM